MSVKTTPPFTSLNCYGRNTKRVDPRSLSEKNGSDRTLRHASKKDAAKESASGEDDEGGKQQTKNKNARTESLLM